ncbi:hypothetical protein [Streptomyces sp. RKAG337]|uniref:hypothetical protein n=1 Tax=Streptomyces sp. RKAG337 TaxID=2893404 RepID=UPI0020346227|nr:hypothetical protein [Streptomyces sp. RKAG337]MCM2428796.1 hypothetical protein [Streptomyces sp. RKAG337]
MTRRMLLFAALLLGIFAMHTVGHPAGGGHQGTRSAAVDRASQHGASPHAMGMAQTGADRHEPAPAHEPALAHRPAHEAAPAHRPAHDTSPLTVCLAVLGTATAVLLAGLLAALGLLAGPLPGSVAAARSLLPRGRWPWPPPPRIPLSRLPVLRI